MPKISVIMPSLNVTPYIKECMDSVIGQTLEDIEILCIDAGSTDGTWEILEEYAGKDSRIKLIKSSKKSYGYQMNLGLKEASGEYIGIVETDDFILPETYEELYTYAKENNADFVKADFDVFTSLQNGERLFLRFSMKKYSNVKYHTVFSTKDYVNSKETIDVFIWNGIYKKDFLQDNQILFQETPGAAFQDCSFRYQVALCVKRGFFLDSSYYCYRRDNMNSSTYNSRCVLFNLAECKYILSIVQGKGGVSREQIGFLAREMAIVALRPYVELLCYGQPAEGTREALEEFQTILKDFLEQGILEQDSVVPDVWLEIRMFVENLDFYDYYAHLKSSIVKMAVQNFLKKVVEKEHVVIFGSGYIGSCVYCMIRNNGIENVAVFCDNAQSKWGSMHMGCPVMSPEDVIGQFPDAYFIVSNAGHSNEIREQLLGYGISEQQIAIYGLSTFPLDCTNMAMRFSE